MTTDVSVYERPRHDCSGKREEVPVTSCLSLTLSLRKLSPMTILLGHWSCQIALRANSFWWIQWHDSVRSCKHFCLQDMIHRIIPHFNSREVPGHHGLAHYPIVNISCHHKDLCVHIHWHKLTDSFKRILDLDSAITLSVHLSPNWKNNSCENDFQNNERGEKAIFLDKATRPLIALKLWLFLIMKFLFTGGF